MGVIVAEFSGSSQGHRLPRTRASRVFLQRAGCGWVWLCPSPGLGKSMWEQQRQCLPDGRPHFNKTACGQWCQLPIDCSCQKMFLSSSFLNHWKKKKKSSHSWWSTGTGCQTSLESQGRYITSEKKKMVQLHYHGLLNRGRQPFFANTHSTCSSNGSHLTLSPGDITAV